MPYEQRMNVLGADCGIAKTPKINIGPHADFEDFTPHNTVHDKLFSFKIDSQTR